MNVKRKKSMVVWWFSCFTLIAVAGNVEAVLDAADPNIISLYLLNEASSGQLNNTAAPSFYDTAAVGTAQNHDGFSDFPSDGPTWANGTDFEIAGTDVGTGTGLLFNAGEWDRTRTSGWQNVSQGAYTDGNNFTIMVRGYFTEALDGETYGLYCQGVTSYLRLQGTSQGE